MANRSHRTDTSFFVVVVLLLAGGLFWAAQTKPKAPPVASVTSETVENPSVTTQTAPTTQATTWTSGELIILRGTQVIGRKPDGTERTVYSAPASVSIVTATSLVSDHVLIQLSSGSAPVIDLNVVAGSSTARTDLTSLALAVPRPTTSSIVKAVFSNAERDFGTKIVLMENGKDRTIYQTKDPVTDLAWRTDGDALAIGTQTGVVVVAMTSGDAVTTELGSPIRSLTWAGSDILAVSGTGTVNHIVPGKPPETVTAYGTVGRDFLQLGTNEFVWLSGAAGESDLTVAIGDPAKFLQKELKPQSIAQATQILGVLK